MSVEVHTTPAIDELVDAESLIKDFHSYKCGTLQPTYFGRDGDYSKHSGCRDYSVWHIHLQTPEAVKAKSWLSHLIPYRRTSEKHLVYCEGFYNKDHYLLIGILEPEAHAKARDIDLMNGIATIAKNFQEEH